MATNMARTHKELRPEDLTAIVDTREQLPWTLAPLQVRRGTLATADYSIAGLTDPANGIAVERKSLEDLLGCIGQHRERFENEMRRILAYRTRAVIVEAPWGCLELGQWRSRLKPPQVIGSVLGWIERGIPFLFAQNASEASTMAARFMFIAARRRFYELGAFHESLPLRGSEIVESDLAG